MLLTDDQRDAIKVILSKIQNKEELLALLNAIKKLSDTIKEGQEFQPIKLSTLTYFADYRNSGDKRYYEFSIKKKNGSERIISAPAYSLKVIQQCLTTILTAVYEPKICVTGFRTGKSIIDNATPHKGKRFVFNVDLQNFFPSIQLRRVKAILKLEPFNLTNEREPLAFLIARLCCIVDSGNDGYLPQGAPTSPILSNIVCQQLDRRLGGLAKRFGAVYTRYADDITFSADAHIFHGSFEKEMRRIIENQNFTINQAKVRVQGQAYRQEVTGLTVNEKVNVSKRYIREVRAMLHNWQKLEYEQAEIIFRQYYQVDKGHVKKDKPILRNVLHGKLNYLKMVRGESDPVYLRYKNRFEVLEGRPPIEAFFSPLPSDKSKFEDIAGKSAVEVLAKLEKLLSLWESGGLDAVLKNGNT